MTADSIARRRCARCGKPGEVLAYWGDPLCRPCCHTAADFFEARDCWPRLREVDRVELDAGMPEALR